MPDRRQRILIVDDDEAKRYTISRTLQRAGYEVAEAVTGLEGLREAPGAALIVLDVKLPDIDGYEVCRRLRADPATAAVPILQISTTFTDPDSRVQGLENGADAYLTNATEPPVLVATVRALLRMRRAEERLRQVVESAIDFAIFSTDPDGRVVTWNSGAEAVFGWPEGEIVGQLSSVLFTPEDRAVGTCDKELATAAATGRASDERWHVRKDGTRFFASGVVTPIRGPDGRVDGFTKVARDVTERQVMEDALRMTEERLRLATDAADLGTWDYDPVGGRLEWSDRCKELFGLPPDAAVDFGTFLAGLHPDDVGRTEAAVARGLDPAGPGRYDVEYRTVGLRDGVERWVRATGMAFFAGGRAVRFVGTVQDVTDRVRSEARLRDEAKAKDEFLAMLAHELRNPLAPIRTAMAIQALPAADPSALARSREVVNRQVGHMVRLIDDLLDVGRITQGRIDLRKSRVALRDILDAAVETSRPLVEASRHTLTVDVPADPIALDADPTRLAQVVANLLNNAAKYTPEGGVIRLSAGVEGGEAVIRVADNGVGIAAGMLPRVWDLFTQIDRTLVRAQGGLGIGLTLVKRLAEMHGGTVSAASDGPGAGVYVHGPAASGGGEG